MLRCVVLRRASLGFQQHAVPCLLVLGGSVYSDSRSSQSTVQHQTGVSE